MNEEIQFNMGLNTDAFSRGMRSVKQAAHEGLSEIKTKANEVLKDLFAPLAGLASAEGLKRVFEFAEAISHLSAATGASTGFIQTLRYGVSQTGGDAAKADKAVEKLAETIGLARSGSKEAAAAFTDMGVAINNTDGTGKSLDDIFGQIADKIKGTKDASLRAAEAFAIFGKSGVDLIPVLRGGTEQLGLFATAAHQLTTTDLENLNHASETVKGYGASLISWAGSVLSMLADGSAAIGAFSADGMKGVDAYFNGQAREQAEAAKALAGIKVDNTKTLLQLAQQLADAQAKTQFDALDKEEKLNSLMEKSQKIQDQIKSGKLDEVGVAQAKLELEKVSLEINTAHRDVVNERLLTERAIAAEKERQKTLADEILGAENSLADAEQSLVDKHEKNTRLSLHDLATSKFNFGGEAGDDQRTARQIELKERQRQWFTDRHDYAGSDLRDSEITELRHHLSKMARSEDRDPDRNDKKHIESIKTHLDQLMEKVNGKGMPIEPRNGK